MTRPAVESLQADRPGAAALDEATPRAIELHNDELIEMSIKPSYWYIPIVSVRVAAGAGIVALAALLPSLVQWQALSVLALGLCVLVVVLRLAVGTLQWASRLFLLTNRRVVKFQGVLEVVYLECALKRVREARLEISSYQKLLGIGTILIVPADESQPTIVWKHIGRPKSVHEKLLRVIRRSQSSQH